MRLAWRVFLFGWLTIAASLLLTAQPNAQDEPSGDMRIGILAHRGWPGIERYWTPLQTYLAAALDLNVQFVPVTLASAGPLIENGTLQFLITNPGHYVTLEKQHQMSVIATLHRRLSDGSRHSEFGSAIVTLASSDIATLKDGAGKRVTAVDRRAFGGFQVGWLAFTAQGVDPFADFAELAFVGFPQDRIIAHLLSGDTDIGIVRSGLIETMAAEGRLDISRIRVLNDNASFTYPDAVSTRLYPEWPFLALAGIAPELRDRTALALLQTRDAAVLAEFGLRDSWGAPLSYHAARTLDAAFLAATAPKPAVWWASARVRLLAALLAVVPVFALLTWRARLRARQRAPAAPTATTGDTPPPATDEPPVQLTQREAEILALVTDGLSSKEIARRLEISPKTVEFHRSNLLRKHDAKSVVDLVRKTALTAENAPT